MFKKKKKKRNLSVLVDFFQASSIAIALMNKLQLLFSADTGNFKYLTSHVLYCKVFKMNRM